MRKFLIGAVLTFIMLSCETESETDNTADFDRKGMLTNWADNIIIPSYTNYKERLTELKSATDSFKNSSSTDQLVLVRNAWKEAYLAWQDVSIFDIGKAEELLFRSYTNTYPAKTENILNNIESGEYNLTLSSTRSAQGFPAIDYLINGLAGSDSDIVKIYTDNEAYKDYLSDLVNRLDSLTTIVSDDWTNNYRDVFIANDASTATGSVSRMTNDFIFYYEKALRTNKIGFPAGVFSGTPAPNTIESKYMAELSKPLFERGLMSVVSFFNGDHFDGNGKGMSMATSLTALDATKDGQPLAEAINAKFEAAKILANGLNNDLAAQVETDNVKMTQLFDALQEGVILLKVDMTKVLQVKIDFVDADGD